MAKIIVVEDENPVWKLLEFKLRKSGHTPLHAKDGEEALELSRENHPDLILLDLMIPYPDGIQVLKTLKEDTELSTIPVIILSSLAQDNNVLTGLKLGAEDYLTKPFSPEELILRVNKLLLRTQHQIPKNS